MKTKTIAFTACLRLSGIPVGAKPLVESFWDNPEDFTKLGNISRLVGWIQATCIYAKFVMLSPEFAQVAIKAAMSSAIDEFGADSADWVRDLTLKEQSPECKRFWAREFLHPQGSCQSTATHPPLMS